MMKHTMAIIGHAHHGISSDSGSAGFDCVDACSSAGFDCVDACSSAGVGGSGTGFSSGLQLGSVTTRPGSFPHIEGT